MLPIKPTLCVLAFLNVFTIFGQTNQAPTVTAGGDQIYCPQTQQNIVTSFDITDPDDTTIAAFYIQISTGNILGEDQLFLTGSHPAIAASWNVSEARLTLTGAGGGLASYSDIIAAVLDVVFSSNNLTPVAKTFSLSTGTANFFENGHYYEFVADDLITWTDAKVAAENRDYFGLPGYLATLTTPAEAQIAGELTPGTGWIGGTDEETEGVWKWATGPEAGTVFWNGLANGSTPNYANWNTSEPNNFQNSNEDYAHIKDDAGVWSPALSNTATTTYTFKPDTNQCASSTSETIIVNMISTLTISATNMMNDFDANQIISVEATGGSGAYEYQIDGGIWQSNSVFEYLIGCRDYTIAVRDALGCSATAETIVSILEYPKFFTPNGDGYNDTWNIKCLKDDPSARVSIFDRYGKLLSQFKPSQNAWNGVLNGSMLAGTDYWFSVYYMNNSDVETQFKSHFSLRH